jgi:hypothetical protein
MVTVEFEPPDEAAVLTFMSQLAEAHDGWINLLPGVAKEDVPEPPKSIFGTLFGGPEGPVSMSSWFPAPAAGRLRDVVTIGIMHPRGRYAAAQLADLGVPVPEGWRVRQDHARRGLILRVPAAASHPDVLGWTLRAGEELTVIPVTGKWQARVYLPRRAA